MPKLNSKDVDLLEKSFSLACTWHADDLRKGTDIPYLTHLMDVSSLVLHYGGTSIQAAGALLHDSIEDASDQQDALIRKESIRNLLGDDVLSIVEACSDGLPNNNGIKPPWQDRKTAYIQHLSNANEEAWLVSCCDKLHNSSAIVSDLEEIGEQLWDRFNATKEQSIWYYSELSKFFNSKNLKPAIKLAKNVERIKELSK